MESKHLPIIGLLLQHWLRFLIKKPEIKFKNVSAKKSKHSEWRFILVEGFFALRATRKRQ